MRERGRSSDSHGRAELEGVPPSVLSEEGSVELIDVTKRFGDVVAVDALSLQVQPAEFLSLLGPSGCGKTTTLRMLAGFEEPDGGRDPHLGPGRPGRAAAQAGREHGLPALRAVPAHDRRGERRLRPAAEEGGQVRDRAAGGRGARDGEDAPLANRKPRQLSGGQQQRVALARALVNRPSLLLLDEPLGALDRKLREEMQIELKLLQSQVGITFIFVTHDQGEALSM